MKILILMFVIFSFVFINLEKREGEFIQAKVSRPSLFNKGS